MKIYPIDSCMSCPNKESSFHPNEAHRYKCNAASRVFSTEEEHKIFNFFVASYGYIPHWCPLKDYKEEG